MKTKVLITVKAYPAISNKYGETVCTAGITEDGKWIRIYPIPFRKLNYTDQFKKYHWVEIDLIKNGSDFRPESYRPLSFNNFNTGSEIKSDRDAWLARREVVTKKVYTNLETLISEAKDRKLVTSLATFKPTKFLDFVSVPVSRNWSSKQLLNLESMKNQGSLFDNDDENEIDNFEVVDKLPYKFSYKFEDDRGKESTLMIEDWEIGMLYWRSLLSCNGDEKQACEKVKEKYFYDFAMKKDIYLFLGTTKVHHFIAPNPFVIIGVFYPKPITQESLF